MSRNVKEAKTITVEQIGSPIRKPDVQQRTLIGLGLNKMHRRRTLEDTPSVRGMIRAVQHLVRVVDEDGTESSRESSIRTASVRVIASADRRTEASMPRVDRGTAVAAGQRQGDTTNDLESVNLGETNFRDYLEIERFDQMLAGNPIAAIELASSELAMTKENNEIKQSQRAKIAHYSQALYNEMFSGDEERAGKAAYALISNSRTLGKGLSPNADISRLSEGDADQFRRGISAMLQEQGVAYLTWLAAHQVNSETIDVELRISRSLAFTILGQKVTVGEVQHLLREDLVVGCPVARAMKDFIVRVGDGVDLVVEAKATFIVPEGRIIREIPVVVSTPALTEVRSVPIH